MPSRLGCIILAATLVIQIGCAQTGSIIQHEPKEGISVDGGSRNEIDDLMTARIDGERHARANVSRKRWFAIGCLGGCTFYAGPVVVAIVHNTEPKLPATCLLGKSPEYIAAYTNAYKATAKSKRTANASFGCLIGTGLFLLIGTGLVTLIGVPTR
jgi:hypothetical protein